MELYLLRHGRTDYNERRLYCGSTDLPLTPGGRAELEALADRRPLPNFFLTADTGMLRTRETADILVPPGPRISLPDLREMDFGRFEGFGYETLRLDPVYIDWITDKSGDFVCPAGESRNGFYDRVRRGFREWMASLPPEAERVCLVCHGGTVCAVMDSFCEEKRGFYDWQPDNGRGWRIQVQRDPLLLRDPISL